MERIGADIARLKEMELRSAREGLTSIKETQVFGREDYFASDFRAKRFALGIRGVHRMVLSNAPRLFVETATITVMLGVFIFALSSDRQTSELTAVLGLFAVAGLRLLPSANRILTAINQIRESSTLFEKLCREYATLSELIGSTDRPEPPLPAAIKSSITLDEISFRYPGQDQDVLKDISLTIPSGQSLALVGPSGAGKTTLADIILGVLSPTAGAVLIDGQEIPARSKAWRAHVGFVPQVITLTNDTLRRNIAFALPDSEIDEARIARAVRLSHLEDFVSELPDGLDTDVGERGIRLSGGQRQRVGIARALYHDPDLIVLDEATSALDTATESEIAQAIDELRKEKTMIIIAHRLSTVRNCDRLAYLEDGRLVAVGGFGELVEKSREFKAMVELSGISVE